MVHSDNSGELEFPGSCARCGRELLVPTKCIRQLHLPRRSTLRLEQPIIGHDDRRAPGPRRRHVQSVDTI